MKLSRADRRLFAPGLKFPDKATVAQIKHAILNTPVITVQEQQSVKSTQNTNQVFPPDFAIFEDGRLVGHTCHHESFIEKLYDAMKDVEKRRGKKPFVITRRI